MADSSQDILQKKPRKYRKNLSFWQHSVIGFSGTQSYPIKIVWLVVHIIFSNLRIWRQKRTNTRNVNLEEISSHVTMLNL